MDSHIASTELVFLGIAERATNVREGDSPLLKLNIIGLKNFIPLFFTPFVFGSLNLVFAMRHLRLDQKFRIVIRSESGDEFGALEGAAKASATPPELPLTGTSGGVTLLEFPEAWTPVILLFRPVTPLIVLRFGRYLVLQDFGNGNEKVVGEFSFLQFDPAPLTPERIAAIKSDPRAMKAVRIALSCKECNSNVRAYAALERNPALEADGYVWYADIGDSFTCACRKLSTDLTSVRKNLGNY